MWQQYQWMNEPSDVEAAERLTFRTLPDTDFWRNTHYGFNRMTAHALLTGVTAKRFTCRATLEMKPNAMYDQAGILLYVNDDHWLKTSVEYIPDGPSHLGAVVTSHGYSDWSTRDFSNEEMGGPLTFELVYTDGDVEVFFEYGNGTREQLRIAHLHDVSSLQVGPYACSPDVDAPGFTVTFTDWQLSIT
ncbi:MULTISPECIES: DUF1349 domain-containing protein [Exiguobacterium]|uniref:DUF1349 domain-containing protein n=1 Tax=Exiguobacterium TaxID=33986 RepID=UPI001BE7BFF5|nr:MULTISPECIES: DUF1349 domain-containing protein [Exiguobacterium]MCT4784013.1 DUF1349 domain-containing protein [Exiguobacterium himgiriensis]